MPSLSKTLFALLMIAFVGSLAVIPAAQWKETEASKRALSEVTRVERERDLVLRLMLELERFRADSPTFRRLPEPEIQQAKARVRQRVGRGLEELGDADMKKLWGEYLAQVAKWDPVLVTRNPYIRPEIQELHEQLVAGFKRLENRAEAELARAMDRVTGVPWRLNRATLLASVAALVSVVLMGLLAYWVEWRPRRRLSNRVEGLKKGVLAPSSGALRGPFGRIEEVLRETLGELELHKQAKSNFVTSVAAELRPPLLGIRSAVEIAHAGDAHDALSVVRQNAFRLSTVMEGMEDLLDASNAHVRLSERVVDAGELLARVAAFTGDGGRYRVRAMVPKDPIWVSIDPERFERAVVYLISKLMIQHPEGMEILVSAGQVSPSQRGDLVIAVEEGGPSSYEAAAPEVDLTRHWAIQTGFGTVLAEKIIRAHGGSITASGIAGTRMQFRIRLPRERMALALGLVIAKGHSVASHGFVQNASNGDLKA